jgi:hypothetical protein
MGEQITAVTPPPSASEGHETTDVRIKPLAIFLAGLTISLVVVSLFVAWLLHLFLSTTVPAEPSATRAESEPPPIVGPLLQVSARHDLEVHRAREDARLAATEWVDAPAGIVRIPIDEAINLAAERGLPKWPPVKTPASAGQQSPPPAAQPTPPPAGAQP